MKTLLVSLSAVNNRFELRNYYDYLKMILNTLRYPFKNVKNMISKIANKIQITLCLVSNQFSIVHTIPCVTFHDVSQTAAICFNLLNNCSVALYNRNIQTTIMLFTRDVSSQKIDCILSEFSLLALSCVLYHKVYHSLMNALEGECLCLHEMELFISDCYSFLYLQRYRIEQHILTGNTSQ